MPRHDTLTQIVDQGVVPVIAGATPEQAVLVVEAIYGSGIRVVEITIGGPETFAVLEKAVDTFGDKVTFGAGTVLVPEAARACIKAGAEFIVSPIFNRWTIDAVKNQSKAMIPGALTPTEVVNAWEAKADAVMIFPCGAVGGPKYLASLKHTFPEIDMMPTGSLNLETTTEFLKAGASAVAVGAAFIDAKNIAQGKYVVFEERARRYLAEVAKSRTGPA